MFSKKDVKIIKDALKNLSSHNLETCGVRVSACFNSLSQTHELTFYWTDLDGSRMAQRNNFIYFKELEYMLPRIYDTIFPKARRIKEDMERMLSND